MKFTAHCDPQATFFSIFVALHCIQYYISMCIVVHKWFTTARTIESKWQIIILLFPVLQIAQFKLDKMVEFAKFC